MADSKFEVTLESSRVLAMLASFGDKMRWKRILKSVVALVTFKDVIDHFKKQEGPEGRWPALTGWYKDWKRKKYPGRPMLVLSSRLWQNFLPSNVRSNDESSVVFFNPVEYARKHDRGLEGIKKRQFMWVSRRGQDLMDKTFIDMLLKGS